VEAAKRIEILVQSIGDKIRTRGIHVHLK